MASAGRLPLMAGNWKMNLNHHEAAVLVQKLAWTLADKKFDPTRCEVAVLPPYTDLRTVQTLIDGDKLPLKLGAQDVSLHENGAYTGEISAAMLARLGCRYVTVGHSERREYHHEDDATVNAKARRAIAAGIIAIVCVGEGLEVRREGSQVAFTLEQLERSVAGLGPELVVAYEPVWAIGTGEVATPEDAQEVCAAIRRKLSDLQGADGGAATRILYGGSVKAANVAAIMAQPDVDGCLVGGASLQADEFGGICRFYDMPVL